MEQQNLLMFIINISMTILLGVIFMNIPRITRKSLVFGVKVSEQAFKNQQVNSLKKRYYVCMAAISIASIAAVILQFVFSPNLSMLVCLYLPFVIMALYFAVYIPSWKKMLALKSENNWDVPLVNYTELRQGKGTVSSVKWFWYIASALICVLAIITCMSKYDSLPDMIATHFNAQMQPDDWTAKSVFVVISGPLFALGMMLIMLFTSIAIALSKLQVSNENPALSFAQHRIYRSAMGHACGFMGFTMSAAMIVAVSKDILFPNLVLSMGGLLAILLLPVVPLLVIPIVIGQGGCKCKPKVIDALPTAQTDQITQNTKSKSDDNLWKLGQFYFNPDDRSLFVEERFGTNIGLNYAHLGAKIFVFTVILGTIVLYIWITPFLLNFK